MDGEDAAHEDVGVGAALVYLHAGVSARKAAYAQLHELELHLSLIHI